MSRTIEIIDGADVPYGTGLSMQCRAIDSLEDPQPQNLLDYYSYDTACSVAMRASQFATQQVLNRRKYRQDGLEVLRLPNADDVYSFVVDDLEMEPVGKLIYVRDGNISLSGVTYPERAALVFRDRILQDFSGTQLSNKSANFVNSLRVEGVAVHELTHLAGMQDRAFFIINHDEQRVSSVYSPHKTLCGWPNTMTGEYFEEGLGVMVQNMFAWKRLPGITRSESTKAFQPPSGIRLDIPQRMRVTGTIDGTYTHAGYGIERLVALAPESWDIFMESRKYSTAWMSSRIALRECLEYEAPGLFEAIDTTDFNDFDHVMDTTDRIDYLAQRYGA